MTLLEINGLKHYFFYDDEYFEPDSLDILKMRVRYAYSFVLDTLSENIEKDYSVLDIGSHISKYYHSLYCETDSLLKSGVIKRPNRSPNIEKLTPFPISFYEMFYQDRDAGKITCTGRVMNQDFLYTEEMPKINWTIKDSTTILCGFNSIMATCTFRGRDYIAWFTPEIPVSTGPWKFSGLPGLILKVSDTRDFYSFEAQKVYPASGSIDFQKYLYLTNKNNKKYYKAKRLYFTDKGLAESVYTVNTSW